MTERLRFITDARQRVASFTELCRHYGISRTTGYKWLHRANQSGLDYLQELSRRLGPTAVRRPSIVLGHGAPLEREGIAWLGCKVLQVIGIEV